MNNNTEAQGQLAQDTATAQNIEAVDALTDAVLTGEAPADIQRLEAAAGAESDQYAGASAEQKKSGDDAAAAAALSYPNEEWTGAQANDGANNLPETEEVDGRGLPRKVRLAEEDMAVALLRKSRPDLSWADAEQIIKGGSQTQGYVAQAESVPAYQRVEELSGVLANVQAQLDAAARNESLFTPQIRELQKMERDLESQVARAQAEASQEAARQQQSANESRSVSMQTATHLYPELGTRDTALWREANRIATDPSHPDYNADMLGSQNAPLLIAKIAAANLGRRPAPVTSSVPQYEQTSAVRPASGFKSTSPRPPKLSTQETLRASEAATLEAIETGSSSRSKAPDRPYMLV